MNSSKHEPSALAAGIAAFAAWGLVPIYWKLLKSIPATEILVHRFVWTCLFLILLLSWRRRWPEVWQNFQTRRTALFCLGSGLAIALNWFLFIWAVNADRVLETSLGYFMTPLVNVLFGAIFLRERLTRGQMISVLLATGAVINLTFGYGRLPWIALALCSSFGLYGLLRKVSRTAAIPGLFLETTLLTPPAIFYLIFCARNNTLVFGAQHFQLSCLLIASGLVTGVPLLWFAHAARHLRLTTVGFLQYLAPSCTFFLGVFLYREPFTRGHLITFSLIWIALAIFTWEAIVRWRSVRVRAAVEAAVSAAG